MKLLLYILLFPLLSLAQTINCGGNFNIPVNNEFRINGVKTNHYNGNITYSDSITAVTPLSYTTGSLKITNDTKGGQTSNSYAPHGITSVWDTINDQLVLSSLSLGDEVSIRINCDVTTSTTNQEFRLYLVMSIGGYNYQISDGNYFFKTAGTYQIGAVIPFNIGNTQTRDYPAQVMFESDGNATIKVNSFYITINRR